MTGHGYEETGVLSPARNWQSGMGEGLHREVYAWTESGGINSNFFRQTRGGMGTRTISPGGQRTRKGPMVWASMHIWRMTSKWLRLKRWRYWEAAATFLVSFAGTTSWNIILPPTWLCLIDPQTDTGTRTCGKLVYEAQRREGRKGNKHRVTNGLMAVGTWDSIPLESPGKVKRNTVQNHHVRGQGWGIYSPFPSPLGWGLLWGC